MTKIENTLFQWPAGGFRIAVLYKTALVTALILLLMGVWGRLCLTNEICYNYHFFNRHLLYTLAGCGIFVAVWKIGYERIIRWRWRYLLPTVALILCGWLTPAGGSFRHAWVHLGFFSFQPVDAANFTLIVLLAGELGQSKDHPNWQLVLGLVTTLALLLMSGVKAPFPLLALAILAMLTLVDFRHALLYWELFVAALAAAVIHVWSTFPAVWQRLSAFLSPDEYQDTYNYFLMLSQRAIQNINYLGTSDPAVLKKLNYAELVVPLFSARMGGIFAVALILGYLLMALCLIMLIVKIRGKREKMLLTGFTVLITVPAFYNFLMIAGLMPMIQLSVPFLSYGGGHLWFIMAALGMIASIGQAQSAEPPQAP